MIYKGEGGYAEDHEFFDDWPTSDAVQKRRSTATWDNERKDYPL